MAPLQINRSLGVLTASIQNKQKKKVNNGNAVNGWQRRTANTAELTNEEKEQENNKTREMIPSIHATPVAAVSGHELTWPPMDASDAAAGGFLFLLLFFFSFIISSSTFFFFFFFF